MVDRKERVHPQSRRQRALSMVALMVLMSMGPLLTVPAVSAHAEPSGVTWPLEGSNDTGWVQLDAYGALPEFGQQATADWNLSFAPGAELSNITLEVRASGQNGMTIAEPHLVVDGMGTSLFDWRGLGVLGEVDAFSSGATYSGRLTPNSNSNAGWVLPSDAEITEMLIEVLAPADPMVSLQKLDFDLRASAVNPATGLLYVAVNDKLLVLHASNNPNTIDAYDFEAEDGVLDLVVDSANARLHMLMGDGTFRALSLVDSSAQTPLGSGDVDQFLLTAAGDVFAANGLGIYKWDGQAWTSVVSATSPDAEAEALAMIEVNNVVYASLDGKGILRYDTATNQALSTWTSANTLHSDRVAHMTLSGNQLLLGSLDNGVGRFDHSAGFWLSTWSSANWLDDNEIGGIERVDSMLFILNGGSLHSYNTSNGVFSTTYSLSDFDLIYDGAALIQWPSTGAASPAVSGLLVDDGSGTLAHLSPGQSTLFEGGLRLASGPSSEEMTVAIEENGVLYIGTADGSGILRYDSNEAAWLAPWTLSGRDIMQIMAIGSSFFVALDNPASVVELDATGAVSTTFSGANCYPTSASISSMAVDSTSLVLTLDSGTFASIELSSGTCTTYDTTNGLPTSFVGDVALWGNTAYVATENKGVLRYDLNNDTWLEPWGSTGINGVNNAPLAVIGDVVHLGLQGYGVARKNMTSGEILSPLLAGQGGVLPSNQIYALETDGSNLYIGTQQGARKWDGAQATSFGQGSSWQTRPQQFFDFAVEASISGGSLYAGTNIGVCKYSIATMGINDCQNVYDGMPNWAAYSVGYDNTYVYGGTTNGVGAIAKSNFQHDFNWGEGTQTGNAVVEIMGDIAYIGTDGLGVLRYNITSNQWLTPFTEDNGVLDGGNDDVTGLVADIRPNLLWIGGDDGFQLINVTTGGEAYDIERNSNLYNANGPPRDMMIQNNIMYYHAGTQSDSVSRLDVANLTAFNNLDIGAQVGENGGDIVSMELVGDLLMVSVVSGQWWNSDGSGGIAQWNTTTSTFEANILPTGAIDRVTSYESSNGNTWVSWGELKLELYDTNQNLVGTWTNFEFPIRGIVEHNGETLFATEDGIARYSETTNQWNTTWESGNGLPSNAGDIFYDLWTDGTNLVVGGARFSNFGQFQEGIVSHRNSGGSWTAYPADSTNNMPDGYPIAMEMCGGLLNVAMYNNNGGIARFDLQNATVESDFDRSDLDGTGPASVACDSQDTLYIGYYNDNQPISRYSYASTSFLSSLTTTSHNLPSDRVWYDSLAHSGSQLIIGHAVGNSGSNLIAGGYSTIVSNGATALQAQVRGAGSPVTSLQWLAGSSSWLIGQAGGSSGYSHVSTLNSNGIQKVVDLPGLVSGQVTSMVANATHIWVATGSSAAGNFGSSGSGLLQGTFLPNGTVEWQFGWTLPGNTVASDFHLHGTDLFIASSPGGMLKLDTTTKTITSVGGSLHGKFDTMHVFNNQLVIGLAGEGGSPPGVQMFNPLNGQFGNGRLIAGLPSNVVNSFAATNAILYIGTNGGVGRWNYSTNDWMDPLTTANGLPVDIVEDVIAVGSDIYMATPAGLFIWDSTAQTGTTMSVRDGLMGQSTWGLTTFGFSAGGGSPMLAISHDGRGSERPGVTLLSTSSQQVDSTHRFDQLPSNTISALTSDWWGVHMATDVGPLTHWNASSGDFEDGTSFFQGQYPIVHMESDGEDVLSIGSQNAVMVSDARTEGHPYSAYITALGARHGTIGANQFWALTDEGLQGWERNGQLTPVESSSMRRALPLNVRAMDNTGLNITDMTHPGMTVSLADPASPHALDPTLGSPGVHGLMFQDVPVILTSPSSGAAIWTKSLSVKYDVLLDISEDPALALNLQDAVDNGQLFDNTRHVSLRLYSPANGSMEVRLTYDYVRSDTPVIMENLVDRPDDGGGVLTASWSLVHDEDFARYLVFISEGPWSTQPTELMLLGQTPDKAISLHSRLQSEIDTANGLPLVDGTAYYGVVVVEYSDGRWGEISEPFGPATPSDEIPEAPAWASATAMGSSGEDGDVELEWARCTALDLAMTNIYVATTPMTDALGRVPYTSVMPNEGNQSMLSLNPGVPVWIGFTCVDEAGQENLSNVTVVGPIVPTGEINDNQAPNPIEGTQADDVPDDEGGRIIVSWNQSLAEDCAFYTVFMQRGGLENPAGETGSVDGFSQASIINNCDENQDIISSLDGVPLIDGQAYTIGVVAYDAWLNGNTDEVFLVSATPFQNIVGSGSTPPRITTLLAFDHAEDDGTAIDVVWEPSTVEDFASYTVWVANAPVSDLSLAYAAFGNNPDVCGCFSFNKQWIDERTNPIELTLSSALYAPEDGALNDGVPALIQPGIELYVAVTVHDLKGNVHLTNLTQATVTPIDNLNDNTAPDRLTELTLLDRPSDDGSALLFEFELSVADDIASYEVYAASFNFNGDIRTQNQGVNTDLIPVEVLGRNPDLPLTIDIVAGDIPVIPGQEVWVAVVARDSSGNAHEDMLTMVSAASEDNGITDPGIYLSDIQEVQAEWFEENSIFVEWDHSTDAKVRGYHIYIDDEMFTTTDDATMVGQTVSANSFLITIDLYEDLDNGSEWYVAVVPYDDNVAKTTVESVRLGALDDDGTTPSGEDENSQLSLEALLTGPNLIAAGMVLIIMLLLVIVVRSRGSTKKRNKNWELQEATWGIQDGGWDAPASSPAPPSNVPAPSPPPGISTQQANDIYAAANQIQTDSYGRNAYQAQQPVLQPQVDPSLLDGLMDEPASAPKSPQIDTSFLDDLL
jgi:type II secretory pathway pseudopilin PulG